jgi:hypothetical protein
MGSESSFVTITRVNRYLPITTVAIEGGEHYGITERIKALVHTWECISVGNGYHIQSSVIHAKSRGSVGFWDQNNW